MSDVDEFEKWFFTKGGKEKAMLIGNLPNDLIRFGFEEGYKEANKNG